MGSALLNTYFKTAGLILLLFFTAAAVHFTVSNPAAAEIASLVLFTGMCAAGCILYKISDIIYEYLIKRSQSMYEEAGLHKNVCRIIYSSSFNMPKAA